MTKLFLNEEDEDDSDDNGSGDSMMGLNAWEFTGKMARKNMIWDCCGSSFYSSGCRDNCEVTPEEARNAITANDKEPTAEIIEGIYDRSFTGEYDRDWDDSCGGNAHPSCTCGYGDGVYIYCACGCGYVYNGDGGAEGWDDIDDENDDEDDDENSDEDDDENRDGDDDSEEAVEDWRSDWKRQRTDRNN